MATYYVDNAGSDGASGLVGHPWQTLAHAFSHGLSPGDVLVLTAGQTFTAGTLTNSGTSGAYIRIGTGRNTGAVPDFASGDTFTAQSSPAIITVADAYGGGLNANNVEYVWFDNLHLQGSGVHTGAADGAGATGASTSEAIAFSLKSDQGIDRLHGVRLSAVSVTGALHGISAWGQTPDDLGWDDLQLWSCSVNAIRWLGFSVPACYDFDTYHGTPDDGAANQSVDIYLGRCQAFDLPGYAGMPSAPAAFQSINVTGIVYEDCVAYNLTTARPHTGMAGSGGYQSYKAADLTYRRCEAYNCKSNGDEYDGEGFALDHAITGILIEGCYIHDNDGAAAMLPNGTIRYSVFARNLQNSSVVTVAGAMNGEIAYVGSSNDSAGDLFVYGNTIYSTIGSALDQISYGEPGTVFAYNNIFVAKDALYCVRVKHPTLVGNLYYTDGTTRISAEGNAYTSLAALRAAGYEAHAAVTYGVFADPELSDPDSGVGEGMLPTFDLSQTPYFNIGIGSPARDVGIDYALLSIDPGTMDFRGGNIPSGSAYDAGAVEYASASPAAGNFGGMSAMGIPVFG